MDKCRNIIAIKEKNCRVVKWSGILIAVASGVSMFALSFNEKKVPDIVMYMMIIGIVMSFVATYIGNTEKKSSRVKTLVFCIIFIIIAVSISFIASFFLNN